jgi:hypothetical protein
VKHYGLDADVAGELCLAGYHTPKLIRAAADKDLLDVVGMDQGKLDNVRAKVG